MKRRAFKLLLFLLAGAMINVAVAWGCALAHGSEGDVQRHLQSPAREMHVHWPNVNPRVQTLLLDSGWKAPKSERFARLFVAPTERSAFGFKQQSYRRYHDSFNGGYSLRRGVWEANSPMYATVLSVPVVVEIDAGWPLPSMGAKQLHFPTTMKKAGTIVHEVSGAFPELGGCFPGSSGYRVPLSIHARGFAINTIFYAAILYALFAVPGAVRRRLRHKRGQCASCGYSLRDTTSEKCPECGVTVQNRAREEAAA